MTVTGRYSPIAGATIDAKTGFITIVTCDAHDRIEIVLSSEDLAKMQAGKQCVAYAPNLAVGPYSSPPK